MRNFNDWPVRYKLIVPLVLVVFLGGGAIISAFSNLSDKIMQEALPEERAIDGIRSASLELLSEYREFFFMPNEATLGEIDELKENIAVYKTAFDDVAGPDISKFSMPIRNAVQTLKQQGDLAIELRQQLLGNLAKINAMENLDSLSYELARDYVSELRAFALAPNDMTRQRLDGLEQELARAIGDGTDERTIIGAAEAVQVNELILIGRASTQRTMEFLEVLEAIEDTENELLMLLADAAAMVKLKTDDAFYKGFVFVGIVILAVLTLIFAVGYLMSQRALKPATVLINAVGRFGSGDLSARVAVDSRDEFGTLSTAFNQMADSLESNVEQRQRAENDLRLLNEELELRVNERTAELRAAQQELLRKERLAALGQVTATVSHELRNPLGTIRNSLFTVSEGADGNDLAVARAIERIERNIGRCDEIIEELLDFSRMRDLKREATDVDVWLGYTLDEYSHSPRIKLERVLASHVTLAIDSERLRRVLINLLDNACEAILEGGAGGGTVTVSSRANDGRLELLVTDSGPGISADVLPKVFEPLYSTKLLGVGLGLPLVRQIMEQHGGGVEIGNQANGGTRVVFWLSLNEQEQEKRHELVESADR